jgi:hypothetical protein
MTTFLNLKKSFVIDFIKVNINHDIILEIKYDKNN